MATAGTKSMGIISYSQSTAAEVDRQAKAIYLLQVEARGELDLREHMQAVLQSMM